jgi:hypothetical protein
MQELKLKSINKINTVNLLFLPKEYEL